MPLLALRTSAVAARALLRPAIGVLDRSDVRLRVLPSDLDLYGHMNNGRYLTLMDLGRFDLWIRSGLVRAWLVRGWRPVLGAATIRYRRSLEPLERYTLWTRTLCWDEKWLYLEQRFEVGDQLRAVGLVKAVVRSKTGTVPAEEALRARGHTEPSPPMPADVEQWRRSGTYA